MALHTPLTAPAMAAERGRLQRIAETIDKPHQPAGAVAPSFYDALRRAPQPADQGAVVRRPGDAAGNPANMKRLIAIDRATLEQLIDLFTAMATAPLEPDDLRRGAAAVLAAMTGEKYDPGEPVSAIVSKRRDVAFRTALLDTDLENAASMTAATRTVLEKRIENAGPRLKQFLLANEATFASRSFVWMEADLLP